MNTIYLAGGCFWGLQKFFDQFDGVQETEVGYANGPETGDGSGKGPGTEDGYSNEPETGVGSVKEPGTEIGSAKGPGTRPSYEDVCENSGHAETVRITYDADVIPLRKLLDYFFMVIDPVSLNRQGNDIGIQYRTGIYYTDDSQLEEIQSVYDSVEAKIGAPLSVEVCPLRNFYSAEEYHQKYLDKNPGGYCHIPKKYFEGVL